MWWIENFHAMSRLIDSTITGGAAAVA